MYDYTAANRDELSFSKGQLIYILDKTNPDWWKGDANGVIGLLPTNYVKMTTTESDPSQQCEYSSSFFLVVPLGERHKTVGRKANRKVFLSCRNKLVSCR